MGKSEVKAMAGLSFIEQQFPVAKLSAESYKERKAVSGQTLTGLGKWWGRKPLILVRACIVGLLMPASADPKSDREIFLKILTMDDEGLLQRKSKPIAQTELEGLLTDSERRKWLCDKKGKLKPRWSKDLTPQERDLVQALAFSRLTYSEKLEYCRRPEEIAGPSIDAWAEINAHLGTHATSLPELIQELGIRRFGHEPRVGDAFCGGGSIPFEAARIGCKAYGSDLNPVAALLTWAAINLIGGGKEVHERVMTAQQSAFDAVDRQITDWGIEHNDQGWRADAFLYCVEAKSPATGLWVPLAPSWVISEKYRVVAVLKPNKKKGNYDIDIVTDADAQTFATAKQGTVKDGRLICPETGNTYPIADLRGDRREGGETRYGLRRWENEDVAPRPDDAFQERLYCVRWQEEVLVTNARGEEIVEIERHYEPVSGADRKREARVLELLKERFAKWQEAGILPSKAIERGYNTDQPIRERGWTRWHHLFAPRQLLLNGLLNQEWSKVSTTSELGAARALGIGRLANWNSRLCQWLQSQGGGIGGGKATFANQALNTLMNYSVRGLRSLESAALALPTSETIMSNAVVVPGDARTVDVACDLWLTDPPYADAINYHELGDFFLAWYDRALRQTFPNWYAEGREALAVQGTDKDFRQAMVDCYLNLSEHMPSNGVQLVMFTHQDPSVWADLGMILWAANLRVKTAWTIATETTAGLRAGNYVQGTVNLILSKRSEQRSAWLDEIYPLIEDEVKRQLDSMTALDDESDPNFGDTDYQLAAYAAALRVLTQFSDIEGMDIRHELFRERAKGEKSEFEKVIDRAVEIACNHLIPRGFDEFHWKGLTASERLYLKGLELERHREARAGAYQELAKGFGVREYTNLCAEAKANQVRFKTAHEFKRQQLGGEGFGSTLTRHVLYAVHEAVRTENAREGLNYLKTDGSVDYWGKRKAILALLAYLKPLASVAHMPHWHEDAEAAARLAGAIENDHG